jgi:hypothetical protein
MLNMIFNGFLRCYWISFSQNFQFQHAQILGMEILGMEISRTSTAQKNMSNMSTHCRIGYIYFAKRPETT